jgi:uncharacterized protein
MTRLLSYIIRDEHFILSSERALFWEDQRTLIVADLHIGKTGHFRKAGINIPQSVYKDDLHRLISQILFFKAERLIIAGDLTHSIANKEMELFRKWRRDFSSLEIHLAKGNHDILRDEWYSETDISVHREGLRIGEFAFIHDLQEPVAKNQGKEFIFSGHVHPVVIMRGRGKQSLRLPCFYFTDEFAILPAFSRFSGGFAIEPRKSDAVFALTDQEILSFK